MSALNLSTVMDAIANTISGTGIVPRAYAWPVDSPAVPCALVGYPTELDFDETYQDGSDRAVFPIFLLVGKAYTRTSRDVLSDMLGHASGIKSVLDGDLGGAVQSAQLQRARIEEVQVAGVAYLSATADLEIYS